ncbi:MAG: hypothetical protein IJQ95_00745 [Paludibacteraceae bacterium]|nr:hypothetical protein [Paludibacteraceae bacterium]
MKTIIFDLDGTIQVPFIACSWGFVPREQLETAGIKHIVDQPKDILKQL